MNSLACELRSGANPSSAGLAVASVPLQNADFDALFPPDEGLDKGTIFPELYMPFLAAGGARNAHEK